MNARVVARWYSDSGFLCLVVDKAEADDGIANYQELSGQPVRRDKRIIFLEFVLFAAQIGS